MTQAAPSTSRRCSAISGIDLLLTAEQNAGFAANANRGLRASDRERDVVLLNSDIEALPELAGVPAVRGAPLRGRRHRRRPAAVPRRAHPVRRHGAQPRRARVVRPPLPLQARRLGPGRANQRRAGGHRRVHVRAPRGDRADRPARRALRDGLRGRRLVPARLAGGLRRDLLPGRPAHPPRVGHARHRPRRARARLTARCSGSAGRTSSTRAT